MNDGMGITPVEFARVIKGKIEIIGDDPEYLDRELLSFTLHALESIGYGEGVRLIREAKGDDYE